MVANSLGCGATVRLCGFQMIGVEMHVFWVVRAPIGRVVPWICHVTPAVEPTVPFPIIRFRFTAEGLIVQ